MHVLSYVGFPADMLSNGAVLSPIFSIVVQRQESPLVFDRRVLTGVT